MLAFFLSSIRYRIFIDGSAMKTSIKAGRMVQIVSISCPSKRNLLYDDDTTGDRIMYNVRMVINVKMIIEWS